MATHAGKLGKVTTNHRGKSDVKADLEMNVILEFGAEQNLKK